VNIPAPAPIPIPPVVEPKPPPPAPPVIAAPAPPPPHVSIITRPDWTQRPNADDLARYYPERAQRTETAGRATISCTVTAKGTLSNCSVVSEDPADMGFGDAAMKMSKLFKMRPKTQDGAPVEGGQVQIPIRFQLPKD
jgi:protein TonB